MADTALDLITNALLDLGVLADEETPTASMAAGALRKLNNMIDAWNIENLLVYGGIQSVFPLISNQGTYTLGTGGNFNIPRPNAVNSAYIRDNTQNYDFPLQMLTEEEYADIPLKTMASQLPQGIYIDYAFPLSNVTLWPKPSTSQYSLVLWTNGIISNLSLNTVISLAPGYLRAIEANLILELAASYGKTVQDTVAMIARSSKDDLKVQNFSLDELSIDPRLTGSGVWNYYTGEVN